MDFARVEAEFGRLKAQFERGDLTEAEFRAQLEELMIEDEGGRWWILGYETGRWYVHDGEKWVQQEPPGAAPGAPPTHPLHPGAADVTPDPQPRPTAAAALRPALGLKLGRDGLSVLLITAGWLVCWGVAELLSFLWVFVGGIGGLITGLVLRRTAHFNRWTQVSLVIIGWFLGWLLGLFIAPSGMLAGGITGLVGGSITALALKWRHPLIQWKHVAVVTLGWAVGWAVGGVIASSINLQSSFGSVVESALWGGIGGAVGSWVMFWQLREATQSSS